MIEKIFIIFVIMEACGLILHITDSVRCWTDRRYHRKQQNKMDEYNRKMYESREREEESMKTYSNQVQYLCRFLDDMKIRIQKLENKSINEQKKSVAKKVKETK